MASTKKGGRSNAQEEEPRHWMNEPPHEEEIEAEESAQGDRSRSTRRRIPTPVWATTPVIS